jgi:pimeloyl-ACP methyl ester carboxylesterase
MSNVHCTVPPAGLAVLTVPQPWAGIYRHVAILRACALIWIRFRARMNVAVEQREWVYERDVLTVDGRTLRVLERGQPDGHAVLVHNGTPNSRLMFDHDVARARDMEIRLISYDRPGYGGSSHQPGRAVADCAEDVRAIAAALGLERLAVWGISGGGPHALACAALLGDLVPAVAVLASIAPWDAPGLDYFQGMGQLNVDEILLAVRDPAAARQRKETLRQEMLATEAEGLRDFLRTLLAPVDAEVLTGELAQYFVDSARSGLAPGSEGWSEDTSAMLAPWGFALGSIRTPVMLLHGRQDRFVPFAHGEWLAAHIPGVTAGLTDDDGHLTLLERHLDEVHAWLLEHLTTGAVSPATADPA